MQRKIKKEKHKHQKAVASFWSYIWSEEEQDWKFIYLFSEILKKKKIGSLCVYIYRERDILLGVSWMVTWISKFEFWAAAKHGINKYGE